ncbi:MAG: sulfotransferase domain-containing protein [Actinomycetota bacterium]
MTGGRVRRFRVRVARHLRWARSGGVGRLIEEDQLDPRARRRLTKARAAWVREHPGIGPDAIPIFLVGVQRSGTNMLVRGLEADPSFDVCNENDRRAFQRFLLRPLPDIRELVERSGHRFVLFKPLAESHRTPELLDGLGTSSAPKAIWAFRDVDGRVRSAVSKFGENNLIALRSIAQGDGDRDRNVSVGGPAQEIIDTVRAGLSPDSLELIRSFDLARMNAEAGAALFWFVRNRLYYELGLDRRDDVLLSSYGAMVAEPEPTMRAICSFLDLPFSEGLVAHVDQRASGPRPPLELPDEIRRRCDDLQAQLERSALAEARRWA